MTVSIVVYTPRLSEGTYLYVIAGQTQRAPASNIPAQVYRLGELCVSVYARICKVANGLSVVFFCSDIIKSQDIFAWVQFRAIGEGTKDVMQ